MEVLTPLTSVTTAPPSLPSSSRRRRATAPTAAAGTATKTISAWRSSPATSMTSACSAARSRSSSTSRPETCQPRWRNPSAIDPPISPVPTTSARRRFPTSAREVIAEPLGAVEVDVPDLLARPGRVHVEEDPDAEWLGSGHGDLGGAQERDPTEADLSDGGGGERARHVRGGGEQHTDDVVLDQVVLGHEFAHELLGALRDPGHRVLVDRRRPAQTPDRGSSCHGASLCRHRTEAQVKANS